MTETTLERFALNLQGFLEAAQFQRLLITRDGKPFALVVGVEHKDVEDAELEASPEFWKMIEERRQGPSVRLADVKAELLADE